MVSAAAANDVIYLDEERDATGTEQVPLLFDFSQRHVTLDQPTDSNNSYNKTDISDIYSLTFSFPKSRGC